MLQDCLSPSFHHLPPTPRLLLVAFTVGQPRHSHAPVIATLNNVNLQRVSHRLVIDCRHVTLLATPCHVVTGRLRWVDTTPTGSPLFQHSFITNFAISWLPRH